MHPLHLLMLFATTPVFGGVLELLYKRATFVYELPPMPLALWTEAFKSLRIISRAGREFPLPDFSKIQGGMSGYITALTPLLMYYLPVAIIIILLILLPIFMGVTSCCMCCCMCCCQKGLRRKYERKTAPGQAKKAYAWVLFFCPVVIVGLSIAAHLGGSNYFSTSIKTLEVSTFSLVDDAVALLDKVNPTVGTVIDNLGVSVNASIDLAIASVSMDVLNSTVVVPFVSLGDKLKQMQVSIDALKATNTLITKDTATLKTNTDKFVDDLTKTNAAIADLSGTSKTIAGSTATWKLAAAISVTSVDTTTLKSNVNSAPDTSSSLSSLSSVPDLNKVGTDTISTVLAAQKTAIDTIASSKSTIGNQINPAFAKIKTDVAGMVDQNVAPIKKQAADFKSMASGYLKIAYDYDSQRILGQMGLVLFYCLPILFISLGGAARQPGFMKCCNLLFTWYYILLFILGLVFLLITVALGDGCTLAFDTKPSPLNQLSPMIGTAVSAVDDCYDGKPLLTVLGNTGAVNMSQFDFAKLAGDQIDKFDFNSIGNIDLTGAVKLPASPTSQLSGVLALDLSTIQITALNDIQSKTVPDLKTKVNSIGSTITSAKGSATVAQLAFTGNPTDAEKNTALSAYTAALDNIISLVNAMSGTNGDLDQIASAAVAISNDVIDLKTSVTNLQTTAKAVTPLYDAGSQGLTKFATDAKANITIAVPAVKANIVKAIAEQQTFVEATFSCQQVAKDIWGVRQGLCGQMVASFDSFWSSLTIMAFWSFISLPVTVFVANTLFLDLTKYQAKGDVEYAEESPQKEEPPQLD